MATRARWMALLALAVPALVRAVGPCPSATDLTIYVRNLSADAEVAIAVDGQLVDSAATCSASGVAAYNRTFRCRGSGVVACGRVEQLRPGAWIHHVNLVVSGSALQTQTQRSVLVAGGSNVVTWTAYPMTFIVSQATETELLAKIAAAQRFAATSNGPALVTFSRAAFPGTNSPRTIVFGEQTRACDPTSPPSHCSALRITSSRLVIDALDSRGQPGAVVLSVGTQQKGLVRILGAGNVLRGLVLVGSQAPPQSQVDTVAISGVGARANRLEQCVVVGPKFGDAVGVDGGAGGPATDAGAAVVIDRCDLSGAQDKGLKTTTGAIVEIQRSCVHDNHNGGVQSSLGGNVRAFENVVQHNVPGAAQNGISVGGPPLDGNDLPIPQSTLVTRGNIVRFAGSRGLSLADNGVADFNDDYVSDGQVAGTRVETTTRGAMPAATFRGVAFVCNKRPGITGVCRPSTSEEDTPCLTDADCCPAGPGCTKHCNPSRPQDVGAVQAACAGCAVPVLDYGTAIDPGGNAFLANAADGTGANFRLTLPDPPAGPIPAVGNQWEHCGVLSCDADVILTNDVQFFLGGGLQDAGSAVDVGTPPGPRAGGPVATEVSPARPAAGDIVRIFGRGFNAFEGAACAPQAVSGTCSIDNPNVALLNSCPRTGNCVQLITAGQTTPIALAAVTPTMIAFRMPFDCYAPATLRVRRLTLDGTLAETTIPVCEPSGCAGRTADDPCDDGNACTAGDHCDGTTAACVSGMPVTCSGGCLTGACSADAGCVPRPATTACDDGDPCTVGDHCSGAGDECVPGRDPCDAPCRTGVCDAGGGCTILPADTACDDGDPCTVEDRCDADGTCVPGTPVSCDDGDPCTAGTCNGSGKCDFVALLDFDAIGCRATKLGDGAAAMRGGGRLARLATRARTDASDARSARDAGQLRAALGKLADARVRLKAALAFLRRRHGVSPQALKTLRTAAHEAVTEVHTQRRMIVDALHAPGRAARAL